MFTGNLIKINNKVFPKITGYKVQYAKLWSSDTGRSMSGENKGTLIGIFPKITLKIGSMTEDEMSAFLTEVNKASISVTYYDTERKQVITASFYSNDAVDEIKKKNNMSHNPIEINLISNRRRT